MASESSEPTSPAPAADASDAESQESEPLSPLQRLINSRNRDISLLLPLLFGLSAPLSSTTDTTATADVESPDPDQNPPTPDRTEVDPGQTPQNAQDETQHRERVILINPLTQGMLVVEGANLTSFFETLPAVKRGHLPASKVSIEAMPSVEISDGEQGECSICLDDWEIDGKIVKEMPCKHRFHGSCIEKWLGIHGSCPICRYKMPVEEEDREKKSEEGEEGERRSSEREIWVSFGFQ